MNMDPLDLLMLIMRYMHILGAITLMGGTIFARFALVPTLQSLPDDQRATVHEAISSRWAKWVGIATGLVLLSGIVNLGIYGARFSFPTFPYNPVAGVKFLLALPIFFIAALLTGRTNLARSFQAKATFWLNVNLTLAVLMVLIGGGLRFVQREPKVKKAAAAVEPRYNEVGHNTATSFQ